MTAEYVFHELKEGRIKLTDEYTVSENAWRKGGAPSHGSTMFAAIHSKVPVDDLLHGMIIQSGNDACIVLAEGLAGNEDEFADKLTQRAREIGLTKSVFTNSNGLPDPNEHVTTRELAMLARHIILDYPEYYKIFGQPDFTWNKIRQPNRNPLLGMRRRRRRLEDRLHQGGRLRPGRLGGAGRLAADRRGQRRSRTPRSAPTKARNCWNGASAISSSAICSPKGRSSAPPRSMAAPAARCRCRRRAW